MYEVLPHIKDTPEDLSINGNPSSSSYQQQVPSQFLCQALFAGGSFCALEAAYGFINGVFKTSTGYIGGSVRKPSYKEVCEGGTGHTEAVKVMYDSRTISFSSLCDLFWDAHDPTNKDFLKFGVSTHERSVIFYSTDKERKEAQESKIRRQMRLNRRIVTKILPLGDCEFYLAENQYQKFHLQKHYRLCGSLGLRSTQQFVESNIACKLNGILGVSSEEQMIDELTAFLKIQELPSHAKLDCQEVIEDLRLMKMKRLENQLFITKAS